MSRKKSDLRLAPGANSRRLRRAGAEHFGQGLRRRRGLAAEASALRMRPRQVCFQVGEFEELLQAEVALELAEEIVQALPLSVPSVASAVAEQVKRALTQRLLLGDRGGGVVVRARVGDAAPEDVAVLVDQHRLGGGRAEVDADENVAFMAGALNARRRGRAARFCSIIWK